MPIALLHNLEHNRVLHQEIALLHFNTSENPFVAHQDRVEVFEMGDGVTRILANDGYMEEPNVKEILNMAEKKGGRFETNRASFFLGREKLSHGPGATFGPGRYMIISFLALFSMDTATYFEIPLSQVIEVGISPKH